MSHRDGRKPSGQSSQVAEAPEGPRGGALAYVALG